MKIKATRQSIASMKLIVPIDGLITVDGNGIADVSAKCAALLVKNTNDWKFLGKDEEKAKSEQETENVEQETEETKVEEPSERDLFVEKVKSAKLQELKGMCEEANLPEEEWKSLTKALLVNYLIKKFDEAEN